MLVIMMVDIVEQLTTLFKEYHIMEMLVQVLPIIKRLHHLMFLGNGGYLSSQIIFKANVYYDGLTRNMKLLRRPALKVK